MGWGSSLQLVQNDVSIYVSLSNSGVQRGRKADLRNRAVASPKRRGIRHSGELVIAYLECNINIEVNATIWIFQSYTGQSMGDTYIAEEVEAVLS